MNRKPSYRQCELARAMTRSSVTDLQITKELASMTTEEWNKQCKILDNFLIAHDMPLDKGWDLMCNDFYNIASANHVNEATLFVAYMDWLQTQKREE